MSFGAPMFHQSRVAVIGGGISGLAAAYALSPDHAVTLCEAEPRLGGHARMELAGRHGDQPVDPGFIVFNQFNDPHVSRLFHDLDVPVENSGMSFGASIDGGRIEYGLRDIGALFAQRGNLARPALLPLLREILRFTTRAEDVVEHGMSVGDLIARLGLRFERYYLLPICGAIWSTPPRGIRTLPAKALRAFFRYHALLSATGQHQWWTDSGGSVE